MVSASRTPAAQFTVSPISMTAKTDRITPKARALSGSTRPAGMGRLRVRAITASISRSYHMLIAPEAPAPTAMQITASAAITGWIGPGARYRPTRPVSTTSDMTRGFSRAR